jgi:hypothetical protein
MAQGIHAFKGFLGAGVQVGTDLRAATVARTHFARFHDIEITESQGEEIDPTSGRRDPESASLGDYGIDIKGTLEGTTEGLIPLLAQSLMGGTIATTTVGTTGKKHTLTGFADQLTGHSRLTLEQRFGTDAEAELLNAIIKSLEFNINQAGYARWSIEGVGSSPARLATPTVPTLPDPLTLLAQRFTTFSLGGSTAMVVRNLSWKLATQLDEDDYDISSRQRRDASYDESMATFDAELTFQDMTELRRFWGSASATAPEDTEAYHAVDIQTQRADLIAGGTAKHGVQLTLPKCFLTKVSTPLQGRKVIRQKVQGRAIYDPSSTASAVLAVTNTVASYP